MNKKNIASKLDLLVINPSGRKKVYQKLGDDLTAIEPPVLSGILATFVRNQGFSVKILDAEAENLSPNEVAEKVLQHDPILVSMVVFGHQPSASTQNMPGAGDICKAIKKTAPHQKIVISGTHPSALPERTLREESVDFVCSGEGPYTVVKLIKELRSASPNYSRVLSLCYQNGTKIEHTPPEPLIKDLDKELPGVAWDLLPMEKYRAHNWHCFDRINDRQPYASIYTSLGCPFKCSFCCINSPFGKPGIRYRSPQNIIEEIDLLVNKYNVRNVKILDEMFVLNEQHVIGIADLIIERKYDLNIWAYARIDTVRSDQMLSKLKQAGFNWLGIGIESASAYVRDGVDKNFGKQDIYDNLRRIRKAGINIGANFIFGLPDDTLKSMQETLDMAIDICPDWANFYSAMAYPGSKLYDWAVKENIALPPSWLGYSQHAYETLPLATQHVSAAEVLKFRDTAFHTFFTHPKYLKYIENRFGYATLKHIQEMTQYRLKRKLNEPAKEALTT